MARINLQVLEGAGFDSNQYLVKGDRTFLIDTGSGLNLRATMRFVERYGNALDTIILTHRHIDHVGGAKALADKFGCEIFASRDDSPPLKSGNQDSLLMLDMEMPKLNVRTLDYGSVIEELGLEVIHSPGHTIGSIVLYSEPERLLFSGDTLFAFGGVGRWDLDTGNRDQLRESIKKISELDIERLYPGHGPWVEDDAREHAIMSFKALEGMWI